MTRDTRYLGAYAVVEVNPVTFHLVPQGSTRFGDTFPPADGKITHMVLWRRPEASGVPGHELIALCENEMNAWMIAAQLYAEEMRSH